MAKSGSVSSGGFFKKSYYWLVKGENFLRHFLLLFIRLYWGILLMVGGFGKWMNAHTVGDYFASLEISHPHIMAYVVGTVEFLGGLSLVLGLFTRFFTILLAVVLFCAYTIAHKEAFFNLFAKPSEFIAQDPFLYLLVALIVLCFGPGFFSLDYWIERKVYGQGL